MDRFERTRPLIGREGIDRLRSSHVLVVGIGGVGSFCVEVLGRVGIGQLTLVDGDTISISNLNRQIPALMSTIGEKKVAVMADRLRDIDPEISIGVVDSMLTPDDLPDLFLTPFDFVVDAVDDVRLKAALAETACQKKIPIVSCLATGNKTDPTKLRLTDLFMTEGDPLARRLRRDLRKRGIEKLPVVWSTEPPIRPDSKDSRIPASLPFVPPAAGILLARYTVFSLLGRNGTEMRA
jgi:tRNA A37 threonylcarbamoyladenosine dehydratase